MPPLPLSRTYPVGGVLDSAFERRILHSDEQAAVRAAVGVPSPSPADELAAVPLLPLADEPEARAPIPVPLSPPADVSASSGRGEQPSGTPSLVSARPSPPAALDATVRDEDGECVQMDVALEDEVEDVVMGELCFYGDDMEVEPEV